MVRFKTIRITILTIILFFVATEAWLVSVRATDWNEALWVVVYPINGDGSKVAQRYIEGLEEDDFDDIESFINKQGKRYRGVDADLIEMSIAPMVESRPPSPPRNGAVLQTMWWSLTMRYWAMGHDSYDGPGPDIKIYAQYYDPAQHPVLPHSLGLKKGMLGVVHVYAAVKQKGSNNVVMTHELLHTLGATDKYTMADNMPIYPYGYAEPDRVPVLPQRFAEIMGGRIAVDTNKAVIPGSLANVVIGDKTAYEINWR